MVNHAKVLSSKPRPARTRTANRLTAAGLTGRGGQLAAEVAEEGTSPDRGPGKTPASCNELQNGHEHEKFSFTF